VSFIAIIRETTPNEPGEFMVDGIMYEHFSLARHAALKSARGLEGYAYPGTDGRGASIANGGACWIVTQMAWGTVRPYTTRSAEYPTLMAAERVARAWINEGKEVGIDPPKPKTTRKRKQ